MHHASQRGGRAMLHPISPWSGMSVLPPSSCILRRSVHSPSAVVPLRIFLNNAWFSARFL